MSKYSEKKITDILTKFWPTKNDRLYTNSKIFNYPYIDEESTIFLLKKCNVMDDIILKHIYITFKHFEWHPGSPNKQIIQPLDYMSKHKIIKILEYCNKCSRIFMLKNFFKDTQFNILYNNCQTQFGFFTDTILIIVASISLISNVFIPLTVFILLFIITMITILITGLKKNTPIIEQCNHIINS